MYGSSNKKWEDQSQGGNQNENYPPDANMEASERYDPHYPYSRQEDLNSDDKYMKEDNEQKDPTYNYLEDGNQTRGIVKRSKKFTRILPKHFRLKA